MKGYGYDQQWDEFAASYGEDLAERVMDIIHELGRNDQHKWHQGLVYLSKFETLDREGGNVSYEGIVKIRSRYWDFKIHSGNWNGTEIRYFERSLGGRPAPRQTFWMTHPAAAIVTMMFLKKQDGFLRRAFESFIAEGKETAIWRTKFD